MASFIGAVPSADAGALAARLQKIEARADDLKRNLDSAKQDVASLQKALADAERRVRERDERIKEQERDSAQLQSELSAVRAKLVAREGSHREELARLEAERQEAGVRSARLAEKYELRRAADRDYAEKAREQLRSALESVRGKVARNDWAERGAIRATEHLMAIEVKLDLLEAAILTLDRRTRAALSAPADGAAHR
ncbi:MAG: hypothetical protein AB7I25_01435 [Vicinamibacterales bacterium]